MNGRGVFLSTKMGRFMATLDPRLLLMLAVRVLNRDQSQSAFSRDADRERLASGLTESAREDW